MRATPPHPRRGSSCNNAAGTALDHALARALQAVRTLEIPHLEPDEEDDPVIH